MNDKQAFAGLLAQVIPVVIVALMLEARFEHQQRIAVGAPVGGGQGTAVTPAPGGGQVPQPPKRFWFTADLLFQALVLTVLAFLEVAALLTAAGAVGASSCVGWFAGVPGAIGSGMLLMALGMLFLHTIAESYGAQLRAPGCIRVVSILLSLAYVAAGITAVLLKWPPSPCFSKWPPW